MKLLNILFLLFVLFVCVQAFSYVMAGEDCVRVKKMINEISIDGYTVQFFSHNCKGVDVLYKDEEENIARIVDRYGGIAAEKIGGWRIGNDWFPPNEIELVDMPDDFPFLVFLSSNYSSSNISHSYILYSTKPTLKKIANIDSLVTEWQVLDRNGSESVVLGFYKNDNKGYFIDRIVPDDNVAICNSCQKYNIEVLKVTKNGLVVVDKHSYDFNNEKERLKNVQFIDR